MHSWSQSLLLWEMIMVLICRVCPHTLGRSMHEYSSVPKQAMVVTLLPTHNHDITHYYPLKLHLGKSIFRLQISCYFQLCPAQASSSPFLFLIHLHSALSIPLVLLCGVSLFLLPTPFLSLRTFVLTHFFGPIIHSRPHNLGCVFIPLVSGATSFLLPSTHLRSAIAPSSPLMSNTHVQASNFSLLLVQESSSIFLICIGLTLAKYFFCFYNSLFWSNAPQTLNMQHGSGFIPELTNP